MAKIHSEGPSAPNGGYLGWFGKGKMAAPFEEAAFSATIGDIVGPVMTQFGYHLIKVEDSRTSDQGLEVEARHILIEVRPSETTRDRIRRELKNLEFLADEVGFEKAVDSLEMQATTSNKLRQKDTFVAGVGSFQSAVRFAYLSEAGAHSSVMQNESHFAIFMLSEINAAGDRPFEEAKVSIKRTLSNEKKLALAVEAATALLPGLNTDSDFAAVTLADKEGLAFELNLALNGAGSIKGLGRISEISGFLETAKLGSISPVFETPRGAVIVRLNARSDFDDAAYAEKYDELYATLTQARQNEVWNNFLETLKDDADIIDNRLRML